MAIARAGAPIGQISGRLGSLEFSIKGATQIVKRSKRPRNHQHRDEVSQQADFTNAYTVWKSLSTDIRTQWRTASKLFSEPNRLGTPKYYSGFQLWKKWYPFHYFPITATYRYTPPDSSVKCLAPGIVVATWNNTTSSYIIYTSTLSPPHPNGARQIWISRFARNIDVWPTRWKYLTTIPNQSTSFNLWSYIVATDGYFLKDEIVWAKVRNLGNGRWPSAFNASAASVVGDPP